VLRALDIKPVRRVAIEARGGPGGDRLSCRVAAEEHDLVLSADQKGEMAFTPPRGFPYYETFLHVVSCRSTAEASARAESTTRGSFVTLRLEVE
jgi:hypothetical protein